MVSSLVPETQIADWCDMLESLKVVIASPHALIPPLSRLAILRRAFRRQQRSQRGDEKQWEVGRNVS
ncbi:hypothetical protein Pmani_014465 [Petrolisthes manimaculis]|uniref:Uncharacterized protein n=1 Tax=Petrolisthes manimaculis TaxID=1843537 RepID=A0AAE1U8P1_9EUCA|nr:hypothetical protein Pmani_014465 [Petrolisthes manimaculis]